MCPWSEATVANIWHFIDTLLTGSWILLHARDQWKQSCCYSVRRSGNWGVSLYISENDKDSWRGALWDEMCSPQCSYGTSHVVNASSAGIEICAWATIVGITSALLTLLHLSHFICAPPPLPIYCFCNIHIYYVTWLCSWPPMSWLKDALVSYPILSLLLNNVGLKGWNPTNPRVYNKGLLGDGFEKNGFLDGQPLHGS